MLPDLDHTLPTDQLHITPWLDPVIDLVGHDLRSPYVERFWLPILGPTTTFLLRRIAASLGEQPEGFDLPLLDTAASLGLGTKGGRNSRRSCEAIRAVGHVQGLLPWRRAPSRCAAGSRLTRVQLTRLPAPLQDEHAAWQEQALRTPDLETQRRRARRLALSLAELGEDDEAIETSSTAGSSTPPWPTRRSAGRSRQQGLLIPPPPAMPAGATAAAAGAPPAPAGRTRFAPGDAA
ncbi:MAG: hypothetical protein R2746_05340 [Acidimicrobiales bacterium]